ncbi:MAG TPA: FdhF/YdeP family oxidoreductase [Geothrix sp.]|nr:FdhF/YdeP family oxidoreductase [Geothrix sp.]
MSSDPGPRPSHPELTPLEAAAPSVGAPPSVSGGLPSVLSATRHALAEMGPLRGAMELLKVNQRAGFDCPGCAWPDPDDRRDLVEFCENGAKAVAEEATTKRLTPDFFARHSVSELASWSDFEIGKAGRLTHPMLLREGATHYAPVTWEEAFGILAEELRALPSPDEAVFYTSGRASNEAAFAYQLFVRMFGTNNLPDCSNMCHESSGVALKETLGVGKGSVSLEDFQHADCILILGQNPGTNHPRMLATLQAAAQRGARIISLNPLLETGLKAFAHPQKFWTWMGRGTPIATLHLPVKVNGDIAALKGLMKLMLEAEDRAPGAVFDRAFITERTRGFEAFAEALRATRWEEILEASGLERERLAAAADILIGSNATIACWAMGLTQQASAVGCIQEVVNLLMLGGHLGRRGAGVCPVRGHSNVQGDRTMGIHEKPAATFLDALQRAFRFEPPRHHGFDTVQAIRAMHEGRVGVFFALGGNFLSAAPDTAYTAEALRRTRLTAHVSTKLNRSHLVTGRRALILPCLGRTEVDLQASGPQIVSVENSMGVVSPSRGNLTPGSEQLRSEVAIVAGLATAVLGSGAPSVDWKAWTANYDRIRDAIEQVVPGFEGYNRRLRAGGFHLPHAVRDQRRFDTPSGRAEFTCHAIPKVPLPEGGLILMTLRSHDQFNTTIYGLNDRYRGVTRGRRVIFLNEADLALQNLLPGQRVDITSHFQGETRRAEGFFTVPYEIPQGCAAAYFPEANVLVPIGHVTGRSHTPAYKSILITLAPS